MSGRAGGRVGKTRTRPRRIAAHDPSRTALGPIPWSAGVTGPSRTATGAPMSRRERLDRGDRRTGVARWTCRPVRQRGCSQRTRDFRTPRHRRRQRHPSQREPQAISEHTLQDHLTSILAKTGTDSRRPHATLNQPVPSVHRPSGRSRSYVLASQYLVLGQWSAPLRWGLVWHRVSACATHERVREVSYVGWRVRRPLNLVGVSRGASRRDTLRASQSSLIRVIGPEALMVRVPTGSSPQALVALPVTV